MLPPMAVGASAPSCADFAASLIEAIWLVRYAGGAPYQSRTQIGRIIELYEGDTFIVGGFAEVTLERGTILANEVLAPADLSREAGERRLRKRWHRSMATRS